jgi:histidyl-tRNA synthetase
MEPNAIQIFSFNKFSIMVVWHQIQFFVRYNFVLEEVLFILKIRCCICRLKFLASIFKLKKVSTNYISMASKPSIQRNQRFFTYWGWQKTYIIQTIKNNFEKIWISTNKRPHFENSETLMGKYGRRRSIDFKILNSGDYWK